MKRNKLLTGFLVLGMGLSLVACSSNEPKTKVAEEKEEKKIEETKAIEEKEEKVKEEEKEEEKAVCGSKIWDIFSSSAVGDTFISSFAGNRLFLDGQSWPECLRSKTGGCPGTDAGFFRIGE